MTHAAPLSKQHAAAVERACRALEAEQPPDLNTLAEQAGMSRFHFHRIFKAATGITPKAYANALRADRARQQLRQSASVTDAMYGAGFNSSGRFYEAAPAILGMTPTAFRKDGEGVEIRFAVGQCALGALLVAASDTGICEIALHEDPEQLVRNLQDRFKAARLIGADREFEQWMAAVVGFVENPSVGLHLPLDVRGTAFQRRVWEALREIPVGATATYTDIAERIGSPRSVRAVARACATNNIALAIPCHRVVRTDGSLAGYRWGIERKRELIEREAKAA
ncbi:bifunctional transcriptional activator/DNA repair enzyme AdaA [Achromobacter xylosoxidans]|jgi:AraC family transcriptional regulator of adaptative response/methylated-DNA-[protein]-cysteine methyltransferase|uniref:methylated-DNA--[protein]-cysteine S-methyltransferase n=1 Tax=Alcaligenes xylosoxydans xylosoxydans TaxID=85698 RepID=A0A9X3R5P5_ALCXX|nr:methylated-DNA--[protein]-cysteine S-methyltransferase [Achromobacter xylosoxidans]MBK1979685.1 methylated-DNA--[protein]-cysteine S-methyltransferase [Achromobacter xylosoxidans]MCM2574037.1 methylated-DNA--[protein]-cysteine S-methyltransferase [Achromobacter xylosoxidans]MCZ8388083.1 methylated-DNA--[protein]-cysteine S-methyltransferase [Achromobacter xylosoxidans]MCZ8403891.1 methylated-DNA--[protein]-cysteine S-methyltransferase [Achromobacter xylosoxidans]MCZ8439477.1 methylated-DNA-